MYSYYQLILAEKDMVRSFWHPDNKPFEKFYSYLKEEWKNDTELMKFPFPIIPTKEYVDGNS